MCKKASGYPQGDKGQYTDRKQLTAYPCPCILRALGLWVRVRGQPFLAGRNHNLPKPHSPPPTPIRKEYIRWKGWKGWGGHIISQGQAEGLALLLMSKESPTRETAGRGRQHEAGNFQQSGKPLNLTLEDVSWTSVSHTSATNYFSMLRSVGVEETRGWLSPVNKLEFDWQNKSVNK